MNPTEGFCSKENFIQTQPYKTDYTSHKRLYKYSGNSNPSKRRKNDLLEYKTKEKEGNKGGKWSLTL